MTFGSWRRVSLVADLAEEAARWLTRREAGELSAAEKAVFEQWVAASPSHHQALERAAAALDAVSRHAAAADIMDMRQAALAASSQTRPMPWVLAASAASVGVAVVALWIALSRVPEPPHPSTAVAQSASRPTHYATAIGERATISLPDGSTATLDTQSELEVAYTSEERGIHLLRGQALFEVAKHKLAPFQVYAGGRRITAVGTLFNVRLDGGRVRVALIEGKVRVAVQPADARLSDPAGQITMNPGEVLDTGLRFPASVRVADARRAASWRDGVAVFVDTPLAEIVAEMNRYSATPVVISDPGIGELRVSGVFKTGDPDRFADAVSSVFPISVDRESAGVVVLRSVSGRK